MGNTTQMTEALQVAMFVASLAILVLVVCIIPTIFLVRRQLKKLELTAEQVKSNLEALVHDSREMVRNVNEFSKRANQQMDNVDQVVGAVQRWTARADRIVNEVGAAIEPPVFSLARNMNSLRAGAAVFLRAFLHRNQDSQSKKQTTEEEDHV